MERTQKQVRERVESVRKKEEPRRRVCTQKEMGVRRGWRREERRQRGYGQVGRLTEQWRVGRYTNQEVYVRYRQQHQSKQLQERTADEQQWYQKHRKGREGWRRGLKGQQKLGRMVVVQLQHYGTSRKEAARVGVPVRGRQQLGEWTEAAAKGSSHYRTYRNSSERSHRRLRRRRRHRKGQREGGK